MRKRRSIEKDYKFYDPPSKIWEKITSKAYPYIENPDFLKIRDLSLMCLIYYTASRVSEVVRHNVYVKRDGKRVKIGTLPSITKSQFVKLSPDFIGLRNVRIVKRNVAGLYDYPKRNEIKLVLKGYLNRFVIPIQAYLDLLSPRQELFPITRNRAYQIVEYVTGEFPHYLREMGLRFHLRIFDKDLAKLKEFSGHERIDNLIKYLGGVGLAEEKRLLEWSE